MAEDNSMKMDRGFFKKHLMKRRATLATITSLVRNKIESIQEEEESDSQMTTDANDDDTIVAKEENTTKNVGERIALFESETRLFDPDIAEESQGYDNNSFQSDNATVINYNKEEIAKFGEKGRKFGQFDDAKHVTYVSRGRTLITDLTNNRVQLCNKVGRVLMIYGGAEVAEPWASALTQDGHIAVTSSKRKRVIILNEAGDILNTFGEGLFQRPAGVCVDKEGRFLITDIKANCVSVHSKTGEFIEYLGKKDGQDIKFSSPRYINCNGNGDIIVSDTGNHCIKIFDKTGAFVKCFGKFGSDRKSFKFPHGVCTSKFGDIFIADHFNNRVALYSRQGIFIRHVVTSTHGLMHPQGIAISPDFTLYITHGHSKSTELLAVRISPSEYENNGEIAHV